MTHIGKGQSPMLEFLLCSMLTILPDFLFRRFVQGKRIGHEITLFTMWFELRWGITLCLILTVAVQAQQPPQRSGPPPSIDERTSGMKKLDGFFPLYWDERGGSLYVEIARFDTDFLFSNGLSAGLGSNDIGLDRGRGGAGRVVRFTRVGPRVLLVQANQSFRSSASNPLERKAVEDSFAKSILW